MVGQFQTVAVRAWGGGETHEAMVTYKRSIFSPFRVFFLLQLVLLSFSAERNSEKQISCFFSAYFRTFNMAFQELIQCTYQAFVKGVIDNLDFDYYSEFINPKQEVGWCCIDGGTQLVPDKMDSLLKRYLKEEDLGKRVTNVAFRRKDNKHPEDEHTHPSVKVDGEEGMQRYMTVFAMPTLACLQHIDLTELELLYEHKDAVRLPHYDTASKVSVQLKYAWVSALQYSSR